VNDQFYLLATINLPDPPLIETNGVIGVDLGIVNLATDSHGMAYSGTEVKNCRRRNRTHRSGLQRNRSRRSRRSLKSVNRKVSRFGAWVNHNISKQIVKTAIESRKAIALEDLKGIRERASAFNREMRWQLGNWAFNQLAQFVSYKARLAGIPVVFVDPRNTSRTCSDCGHCDKANRRTQAKFECLKCGFCANADQNAAKNIGARAAVNRPIVATT
jgi:IS605 OrfB family transposase